MYRDARYTTDMTAAATKRINDTRSLRERQFLEDAGGLAHPIRPESYISMSNFCERQTTPRVFCKPFSASPILIVAVAVVACARHRNSLQQRAGDLPDV